MQRNKIDKSNMRKDILNFPNQFKEGLKLAENVRAKKKFENIVICGMGGSALPGNLLICYLKELISKSEFSPIPVYIHRDYNVPPQANQKSLIVSISYSGNTEETISVLKEAIKKELNLVAITSNGKMEEICKENDIPFVKIPSGIQPRTATGYLFSSLIKILENSGLIENKTKSITELGEKLNELNLEKQGKELAKKLKNKIPLVYASNKFKCLARIWKIKFNENSKIPSFYNYFPELNHNEMVGFEDKKRIKNFYVIILKDKEKDLTKIQKRMKLFANLVKEKGAKVEFVDIRKGSFLFKIFSNLLLGDWTSYYLALSYKKDPAPVKIVEEFKKKLKNN